MGLNRIAYEKALLASQEAGIKARLRRAEGLAREAMKLYACSPVGAERALKTLIETYEEDLRSMMVAD